MQNKLLITTGLVLFIILAINLVGHQFHFRLDLTENNEYTLSPATRNILNDLEDAVTVKAYFTKDLPPDIARTKQDFQEMLIEFNNRSDGKVAFDFINPNESEQTQQEAMQAGIQPVNINVREKDQMKQQRAFLGAKITYHGNQEIIPFIQPGAAMEYALSTAIKKLTVKNKTVIGFVSGHGEPPLSELFEVKKALDVLYAVEEVKLSDSTTIKEGIKTLVIVRPTETYSDNQLQQLDAFLEKGGRLFLALNRVNVDFQRGSATPQTTGLENWLAKKGLTLNEDLILDTNCGMISMQQQMAFGMMTQQVPFPYLPRIKNYANHPATKGLTDAMMKFVSSVRFEADSAKRFTPLAFSSEKSSTAKVPLQFEYQKQWTQHDFPQHDIPIGGVLEGKLAGQTKSKMIVFADGDFPINGPQDQAQRLQPDNINLLVNSVDWLSDDTGLIDLRTKGASSRPIKQLEESTKTTLKFLNFLLPIVLAIGYGIFRMQRNKIKRYRWMSQNYEEA